MSEPDTVKALEITVAVLDQRMTQTEAALLSLDNRMERIEEAVTGLRGSVAKWAGFLAALSLATPFLAALL